MTDNKHRFILIVALLLVSFTLRLSAAETRLFVLSSGDDTAAGSREAPLASLAGARDRIRQLRSEGVAGPVVVNFGGGRYFFKQPVAFSKQDSGSAAGPVTYMAAAGQPVVFTAGRRVDDWQPVVGEEIRSRLPEPARATVRVADLKAQGIDDVGRLGVRGFAGPNPLAEAELFCDNRPMTLARWPNEGFRGVKKVPDATTVLPDTDRPKRWQDEADPWVFACWHHDWAELFEPITGIDEQTGALLRSEKIKPQYGITAVMFTTAAAAASAWPAVTARPSLPPAILPRTIMSSATRGGPAPTGPASQSSASATASFTI